MTFFVSLSGRFLRCWTSWRWTWQTLPSNRSDHTVNSSPWSTNAKSSKISSSHSKVRRWFNHHQNNGRIQYLKTKGILSWLKILWFGYFTCDDPCIYMCKGKTSLKIRLADIKRNSVYKYSISGFFGDDLIFAFCAITFTSQTIQYAEITSSIICY